MLTAGMTAHPAVDLRTGEMGVLRHMLEPLHLTWATLGLDGVATRRPTSMSGLDRPAPPPDHAP